MWRRSAMVRGWLGFPPRRLRGRCASSCILCKSFHLHFRVDTSLSGTFTCSGSSDVRCGEKWRAVGVSSAHPGENSLCRLLSISARSASAMVLRLQLLRVISLSLIVQSVNRLELYAHAVLHWTLPDGVRDYGSICSGLRRRRSLLLHSVVG